MTTDTFQVLDPSLKPTTVKGTVSPRLDSLGKKTIGILWNGRPTGDKIFNRITSALREKYEIKEVIFRTKPYFGNIAPKDIVDELVTSCDAVITGVGD